MSYKQRNGYDRWSNSSDSGDWENSGRAKYDSDGQMYRWDNYSPAGEGYHHHEWINRKMMVPIVMIMVDILIIKFHPKQINHRLSWWFICL